MHHSKTANADGKVKAKENELREGDEDEEEMEEKDEKEDKAEKEDEKDITAQHSIAQQSLAHHSIEEGWGRSGNRIPQHDKKRTH